MAKITFNAVIHEEDDGSFWAEVKELPGCFASGFSLDELKEALTEAIQLYLPDGIEFSDPQWGPLRNLGTATARKEKRLPRKMLVCA